MGLSRVQEIRFLIIMIIISWLYVTFKKIPHWKKKSLRDIAQECFAKKIDLEYNPSNYFNKVSQTIDVNDQYEAGIAKIHFPYSYFNVVEESVLIKKNKQKNSRLPKHLRIILRW